MSESEFALELTGVRKSFGGVPAVEAASLRISAGERVTVQGPSGCGKTTLLRLMAGLETPEAGEIRQFGEVVSRSGWTAAPHLRRIGFVFQEPALWPHMTVAENVGFALRDGAGREANIRRLLEKAGVADLAGRYPGQISGGEAARVSVARALAASPAILLMDEPLAHLDEELRAGQLEMILGAAGEIGAAIVWVTHDRAEAARIGGSAWRIANRRLVPDGKAVSEAAGV